MKSDHSVRLSTILALLFALSPVSTYSQSVPPNLPTQPGMYVETQGGFPKILGQMLSFDRTGSLLAHGLTFGIVAAKGNVQLPGATADTVVDKKPVFYFIPSKEQAEAGGTAGDLVLVRLDIASDRRQLEMAAQGTGRASSGISITHQIQMNRSEVAPGVYRLTPITRLARGEYALYLSRGHGMAAYVYDFSVLTLRAQILESEVPVNEILKRAEVCPEIAITTIESKSAYKIAVTRSHSSRYTFALTTPRGESHDVLASSLDEGLQTTCRTIDEDVARFGLPALEPTAVAGQSMSGNSSTPPPVIPSETVSATPSAAPATITVVSDSDGADVYVDGAFVGNVPATLRLSAGIHKVRLTLPGYKDWTRDITALSGSEVHLKAHLEKAP